LNINQNYHVSTNFITTMQYKIVWKLVYRRSSFYMRADRFIEVTWDTLYCILKLQKHLEVKLILKMISQK
jgi:hypothetical protein